MRRIQLSEHVVKLEYNFGLLISVWMVRQNDRIVLVDTGIGLMKKSILKHVKREGNLHRIALTHGHADHIGALNAILKENPVVVSVHEAEVPFVLGEKPFPGRKKAQKPAGIGYVEVYDQQFEEDTGLTVYHTPGHSPGHVALYHAKDDVLIAGDLFTSKKGRLANPMAVFTENMEEAVQSGQQILHQLKPSLVSICHGKDVPLK